jgi:hypothetical protein
VRHRLQSGLGARKGSRPGEELDPHARGHGTEQREQEQVAAEALRRVLAALARDEERHRDAEREPEQSREDARRERPAHAEHASDECATQHGKEERGNEQPEVAPELLEDGVGDDGSPEDRRPKDKHEFVDAAAG